VGRQTAAEAGEVSKWIAPLAGYLALEIGFIAAWVVVFRRWLRPALAAAQSAAPRVTVVALAAIVAAGAALAGRTVTVAAFFRAKNRKITEWLDTPVSAPAQASR